MEKGCATYTVGYKIGDGNGIVHNGECRNMSANLPDSMKDEFRGFKSCFDFCFTDLCNETPTSSRAIKGDETGIRIIMIGLILGQLYL